MNNVEVSILCLVYNHEKYLRKCLESLVRQKTTFKYEILIHDDASTDLSINIIKEYKEKYPEMIIAVFEKENQHSQGKNINTRIMFPKSKGKYIAFCEGDDFWIDDYKLQKQYDEMEKNENAIMCVHNTIIHDLNGKQKDQTFNDWKDKKILSAKEVFIGWQVHTTSFFIKRIACNIPIFAQKYWFGDYVRLTLAFNMGDIIYLPDVMSVYNCNNKNGITMNVNINKRIKIIEYLKEYNEYTKQKFNEFIEKRIEEVEFLCLLEQEIKNYDEFKKNKITMMKHNNYYKYLRELSVCNKMKFYCKYNNYFFYEMIKKIKNIKRKMNYGKK